MGAEVWDAFEELTGMQGLRGVWEQECLVVFGGEPIFGLTEAVLRQACGRTAVDCCRVHPETGASETLEAAAEEGWAAFASKGYSLRYSMGHEVCREVHERVAGLQELLGGHPVGSNVYATPAGSQGFPPHTDPQNIFVTQVSGAKEWRVWHRTHLPVEGEILDAGAAPGGLGCIERPPGGSGRAAFRSGVVTLRPGDCLYLPRGYAHCCETARAGEARAASIHLTVDVGVNTSHIHLRENARGAAAMSPAPPWAEQGPADPPPAKRARRTEAVAQAYAVDDALRCLPFNWLWAVGSAYYSCGVVEAVRRGWGGCGRAAFGFHCGAAADWMADAFFASAVPATAPHSFVRVAFVSRKGDTSPKALRINVTALPSTSSLAATDRAHVISLPVAAYPEVRAALRRVRTPPLRPHPSLNPFLPARAPDAPTVEALCDSLRSCGVRVAAEGVQPGP